MPERRGSKGEGDKPLGKSSGELRRQQQARDTLDEAPWHRLGCSPEPTAGSRTVAFLILAPALLLPWGSGPVCPCTGQGTAEQSRRRHRCLPGHGPKGSLHPTSLLAWRSWGHLEELWAVGAFWGTRRS